MEFEWNIFFGFTTLQLCTKVQEFQSPKISQDGSSSCQCLTTFHGDLMTMKKKTNQVLSSFLSMPKDFHQYKGHSSDLDQKKWYSTHEYKPQGEWDRVAELMMIKFCESEHPVFRSTSPLSRGMLKSKGLKLIRTIISVNQLSIYGAVSGL